MSIAGLSVAGHQEQSNAADSAQQEEETEEVIKQEEEDTTSEMPSTTREKVLAYFKDTPALYHVAWCESRWRQYDKNGEPFRGEINPKDVGVMQINEYYHLGRARELGYDIHTLHGNLEFAKLLYKEQGLRPWNSSKACWADDVHLALK